MRRAADTAATDRTPADAATDRPHDRDVPAVTPRRHPFPKAAAALGAAVLVAVAVAASPGDRAGGAVVGAGAAVAVTGTAALWRRLRPLLGRWTACAAVSLLWGAVFAAAAALPAECPGRIGDASRCTASEIGTYTILGGLLPFVVAVGAVQAAVVVDLVRRWLRWTHRTVLGSEPKDGAAAGPRSRPRRHRGRH